MTWQEALTEYFNSLQEPQQTWLKKNVLLDAPLLTELPDEAALEQLFHRKDKLNHTAMLKTLVWQKFGLRLCDDIEPINGNIRTFWYQHVDPFYSHHKLYKGLKISPEEVKAIIEQMVVEGEDISQLLTRGGEDQIKKVSVQKTTENTLQQFVLEKIFRYTGPFKFIDSKAGQALIGRGTASIILYCEKEGLYNFIREAYDKHKISIFCSNGSPSTLSLEGFTDQLKAKKIVNVAIGTLVDYDPSGFIIANTFTEKIASFGLVVRSSTMLTGTSLFTEKALAEDSNELEDTSEGRKTINNEWMKLTNGINGQRRSIHINQAYKPRIRKAWTDWIAKEKEHG